jgi:hypothetical protein
MAQLLHVTFCDLDFDSMIMSVQLTDISIIFSLPAYTYVVVIGLFHICLLTIL